MTQNEAIEISHADMVAKLVKDGFDILDKLNPEDAEMWHMATGICGEAGELLDAIKKRVIHRKPLDLENIEEELGDLEFYMQGLRDILGITRLQTLQANMKKLLQRYPDYNYTDKRAAERADKAWTLPP